MSRDVDPSVKHLLGVAAKYDGAAAVILVVGEFRIVVRHVPRSTVRVGSVGDTDPLA
jgi:hypothetical protein